MYYRCFTECFFVLDSLLADLQSTTAQSPQPQTYPTQPSPAQVTKDRVNAEGSRDSSPPPPLPPPPSQDVIDNLHDNYSQVGVGLICDVVHRKSSEILKHGQFSSHIMHLESYSASMGFAKLKKNWHNYHGSGWVDPGLTRKK